MHQANTVLDVFCRRYDERRPVDPCQVRVGDLCQFTGEDLFLPVQDQLGTTPQLGLGQVDVVVLQVTAHPLERLERLVITIEVMMGATLFTVIFSPPVPTPPSSSVIVTTTG